MKKQWVLFLVALVAMNVAAKGERPNIVTVMVDDLGWNQISVPQSTMGTSRKEYSTPNVEMLANKGLSFTHAYTQPNCAPTRAAMLSGQYPARIYNDVYVVGSLNRFGKGGKSGISKDQARFAGPKQTEDVAVEAITVAEALRKNGYATGHIGKYHVGGHDGDQTLPEKVGFDINVGGCTQGHQTTCFSSKDKASGKWVFKKLGLGHFDKYAEPYTKAYVQKYGFPTSLVGTPKHVSDAVGDAMEASIKTLNASGKPFYLQLHPYAVHGPVKARPDLKEAAGGDNFAGFIASVDLIVGRLLKAIDDPNGDGDTSDSVAANTLILFTSDNGGTHDGGDNLPLRGHKGMFTEGGVRVPLIAYWPGVVPANIVTDHMVHSVDYYPTYLELAGNQWLPPESEHPLDGESFADFLRKPDIDRKRDPIFYLFPGYMDARAQPCAVVIDELAGKHYKLLYFYESENWELYNLTDDIGEADNLIQRHPELASTLSRKIKGWLSQQHPTWKPKYPIEKESGKPAGPPPVL
jgi:arylsulfatase A-like enzyme